MASDKTSTPEGDATDRESYRATAWNERTGDPRHADLITDVLNQRSAEQLAVDLSGHYGPFAVHFSTDPADPSLTLNGLIYDHDRRKVGVVIRTFVRDAETNEIVIRHDHLELEPHARRRGFAKALLHAMEPYYCRSGASRIELYAALDDGGYVWARAGYQWDPSPTRLEKSLENVRAAANSLLVDPDATTDDRMLISAVIESLHPEVDDLPSPADLVNLSTAHMPNLGEKLMRRAHWWGARYL